MRLKDVLRTAVKSGVNLFSQRTHNCGQIRLEDAGKTVELYGWLSFSRMNKFLVLRDSYGATQLVVPDSKKAEFEATLNSVTFESVLRAKGTVRDRGSNRNPNMETGEVEVAIDELELLNAAPVVLPLNAKVEASEKTKLSYRFLDLRSNKLQRNLRMRSSLIHRLRKSLVEDLQFVDLETPTLSQWTPGGAHEFIVPAGKALKGRFYSLPQSPQIFKQLLMVGGLDRYFQVARCYRDEGSKLDRQPEFTQLDLEMSFATQENVIGLVERVVKDSWPHDLINKPASFKFERLTYHEVMRDYGVDKPDLRIPWKLVDVTESMRTTINNTGLEDWSALAFRADGAARFATKSVKKEWTRLVQMKVPNAKISFAKGRKLPCKNIIAEDEDLTVFSWGSINDCRAALGLLRNLVGEAVGIRALPEFRFLWVVDFPLFTKEGGHLTATHHPFTAPAPEDLDKLKNGKDLEEIKAQHYDLVLNGVELGGGSVRIHDAALQRFVIDDVLGLPVEPLARFVEALSFGAPPHAGFALGLDRYVAMLCGQGDTAASIRDVIAFPKSKEGRCLTTDAPAVPPAYVLDRYGIASTVEPDQLRKEEAES